MPNEHEYNGVENKLLLLYLIDQMDLSLSRSQITDFVRQEDAMDFFTLSPTLAEMVEGGYLDETVDNNNTRYTITGEGLTALEYFEKHIPISVRTKINNYVRDNRKIIKRDFENTATYFPVDNDEFVVKCGVYEEEHALMEITISAGDRMQAKLIQNNWKANASVLYGRIIETLSSVPASETDKRK